MGTHALPSFARLRQTSGDVASAVDAGIALVLLAASLALLTTLPRVTSPGVAAACCLVLAGSVAVRRRVPLTATTTALVGLVGYELTTHDGYGAVPPLAVALTFYAVGRFGSGASAATADRPGGRPRPCRCRDRLDRRRRLGRRRRLLMAVHGNCAARARRCPCQALRHERSTRRRRCAVACGTRFPRRPGDRGGTQPGCARPPRRRRPLRERDGRTGGRRPPGRGARSGPRRIRRWR